MPPVTVADVVVDPAAPGPSRLSALKRVAACRGEAGLTPDSTYAGQEALEWTEEALAKVGLHPVSAREAAQPWVLDQMLSPRAAIVAIAREWGISVSDLQSKLAMDVAAVRAALNETFLMLDELTDARRAVLVDAALARMRR